MAERPSSLRSHAVADGLRVAGRVGGNKYLELSVQLFQVCKGKLLRIRLLAECEVADAFLDDVAAPISKQKIKWVNYWKIAVPFVSMELLVWEDSLIFFSKDFA